MRNAWVFPGQGSQKKGMADSVLSLSGAAERFAIATEILGRDILGICNGHCESEKAIFDLNDTRNTQPCLFLVESLLVDELKRQGFKADLLAGHSLGEIVALYAAEVFNFETALRLLKTRSELMAAAGGGSMTAVLGFNQDELLELVDGTEGVVVANDNSADQVVLSGSPEAVASIMNNLSCKRSVPLKVSGAFHSPFMAGPAKIFADEVDKITFNDAVVPVLSNVDPSPTINSNLLKNRLKKQMISGVRWRETMDVIKNESIQTLLEIGPGKVLSGLAKRSIPGIAIKQIASFEDMEL